MLSRPAGHRRRTSVPSSALLAAFLLAAPTLVPRAAPLAAQVSPEILQVLQQGGAWVTLDIEDGVGSFQSAPVPTLGIQLRGHLRIWEEHTGSWHVVMRDLARQENIVIVERLMVPGERVDFDYQTGMLGQIHIDVQWSEARDTTLRVWVGTELTPGAEADGDSVRIPSDASRAQMPGTRGDSGLYRRDATDSASRQRSSYMSDAPTSAVPPL